MSEDWVKQVNANNFPKYHLRDKLDLDFPDFETLFEQNVATGYEKEYLFDETIGWLPYEIDLKKGRIAIGAFFFEFQIIGTYSKVSSTWLWGWANEQSGIEPHLLEQANILKQIGENREIEFLIERKTEVDEMFPSKIGVACAGLFNCSTFYLCDYGEGILVITISDKRIPPIDNKNLAKIVECFNSMIYKYTVNHRKAFKHYLLDRVTNFEETGTDKIQAEKDGISLVATFDETDRLVKLELAN